MVFTFLLKRNISAVAASKPTGFREKTFVEAWCSDAGVDLKLHNYILLMDLYPTIKAYPVMGVIAFAVVFATAAGFYIMGTHPDARVSKSSRKSLFRGELKNAEH